MGPTSDPATRNLIGVIRKVGLEIGGQVIKCRQWGHEAAAIFGGKPVNPINAIPGGMSKPINAEEHDAPGGDRRLHGRVRQVHPQALSRRRAVEHAQYLDLILNGPFRHETYSMGLVDEKNRVNFYDGKVRVVDPEGKELCKYAPADYSEASWRSGSSRGPT